MPCAATPVKSSRALPNYQQPLALQVIDKMMRSSGNTTSVGSKGRAQEAIRCRGKRSTFFCIPAWFWHCRHSCRMHPFQLADLEVASVITNSHNSEATAVDGLGRLGCIFSYHNLPCGKQNAVHLTFKRGNLPLCKAYKLFGVLADWINIRVCK